MTELEVLKEMLDRVMQGVFELSDDYLFTKPKKGFEAEWRQEKEIADVLQDMISAMEAQ